MAVTHAEVHAPDSYDPESKGASLAESVRVEEPSRVVESAEPVAASRVSEPSEKLPRMDVQAPHHPATTAALPRAKSPRLLDTEGI
jgi:hypothetical protein